MSYINVQDFLDFGGKNIICQNVYNGFTAPDQIGYNTVLPNPLGGSGQPAGGTSGQVQYNNSGAFGGYTNAQLTALIQIFTSGSSGLAPASGGGTTNFLRADITWAPTVSIVGGTNGQIQFNNSGVFGGLTNAQFTADINVFTSTLSGAVPASGGGTTNFIRADGTWDVPIGIQPQRSATTGTAAQPQFTDVIINLNLNGFTTTIGLPQASTRMGRPLMFVDAGLQAGTYNITLAPFSGDLIVNWITPTSLVMNSNGEVVFLRPFNDGVDSGWFIE